MKIGTNIHGPKRMNPNDLGDLLTFPLMPPAGQSFHSYSGVLEHLFLVAF